MSLAVLSNTSPDWTPEQPQALLEAVQRFVTACPEGFLAVDAAESQKDLEDALDTLKTQISAELPTFLR